MCRNEGRDNEDIAIETVEIICEILSTSTVKQKFTCYLATDITFSSFNALA